ncbi:MAG: carboxypeptidase-like regulatory domain-containing protein, partial [Chitinophagales bacterium]|nr:carboxypeptidase-like regulatory domain-containing protein [Chitinophagales bacterium]
MLLTSGRLLSLLLCVAVAQAQSSTTIRGTVQNKITGVALPYATVSLLNEKQHTVVGATTNDDGAFTLSAPPSDTFQLRVQYLGFQTLDTALMDRSGKGLITVTLPLTPQGHELSEVTVESVRQTAAVLPDKQVFLAD